MNMLRDEIVNQKTTGAPAFYSLSGCTLWIISILSRVLYQSYHRLHL